MLHNVYDPSNVEITDNAVVTNSMGMSDTPATNLIDADPADAMDANVFQQLAQGDGDLTTPTACEIAVDRPSDLPEGSAEQSIEFDSHFSDTSSVVVDTFPFGNPGAPIPGMPQGPSSYEEFQATHGETWAPFQSQRDWDVARWAKTHSTTSSAVAELLAIPDVCAARSRHPLCP